MNAFLMYKDRDFDVNQDYPWNEKELMQDLELNTLLFTMSKEDNFIFEICKKAILLSLNDIDSIIFRQSILKDCIKNASIIKDIYDIAVQAINEEKKIYFGIFREYPDTILHRSVQVLEIFVPMLRKLNSIANEHCDKFESDGFRTFFSMIKMELSEEYLSEIETRLEELKFKDGILISAKLGKGNKGINFILRKNENKKQNFIKRIFDKKTPSFTYNIDSRDESGINALAEIRDTGIALIAKTLAESTDHILAFFNTLKTELAFYIGCLNLYDALNQTNEPICFPKPALPDDRKLSFKGLYDVCLALTMKQKIVSNDLNADDKELIIITGANQGGKSTFLRSIGLAQLMMQCGMFVPAESFCSNISISLFTHYKREEDNTMKSGKLDEELSRMNGIVEHITLNSIILFNESFAATNEREGSEIAFQIVCALLEKRIKVIFVTHLFEFACRFYDKNMKNSIFLRAERQADGSRNFKITEGRPLKTSFGQDLYYTIFGSEND